MALDARNILGYETMNPEIIGSQSIYLNPEQEIVLRQKLCKYIDELKT
jgi:hypothetical protein